MSLDALNEIGLKATVFCTASAKRRIAFLAFSDACSAWKRKNGHGHLERHTPEWDAMLQEVEKEWSALVRAKADERNSRERMFRACRKVMA